MIAKPKLLWLDSDKTWAIKGMVLDLDVVELLVIARGLSTVANSDISESSRKIAKKLHDKIYEEIDRADEDFSHHPQNNIYAK